MKITLAVLLTCHNRKEKTLLCLRALFNTILPIEFDYLEVYLVDDGSTDGTAELVKKKFPTVNVIKGNGKLFWNQGMRLAWKKAAEEKDYDYYLWLNDDTILDHDGLLQIFNTYREAEILEKKEVLITAACRAFPNQSSFSYGGRTEMGPVIPNGELQGCKYINGNAVFLPKGIYRVLGNLSADYTHAMGDFDYGLRAAAKGFKCYTTKEFIATCPPNEGIPGWCNPERTLKDRWKLMHSPFGLNIKEYKTFRKKFWGNKWIIFTLKAYFKMLSPNLYNKIS